MITFFNKLSARWRIGLLICLLPTLTGCNLGELSFPDSSPLPNYYAYSIRYAQKGNDVKGYLAKIDIRDDKILSELEIESDNNDLSIEPDGNVLVSKHCEGIFYLKTISRYYPKQNRLKYLFKTRAKGITQMFPIGKKLFILTYIMKSNPGLSSGIEIFEGNPYRFKKSIHFGDYQEVYSAICLSSDKKKIYAGSSINNKELENEGEGNIFILDTEKEKITKFFDFSKIFGHISGIEITPNDKLYITYTYKQPGQKKELNKKILVISAKDFKLIKTIPIGIVASKMVYVKKLNRLYVGHTTWGDEAPPWIDVIDCNTDKVIAKINGFQGVRVMSYVGNLKMYITVTGGRTGFGTGADPGILVADLKTNKIIKKIKGNFAPISLNLDPVDEFK